MQRRRLAPWFALADLLGRGGGQIPRPAGEIDFFLAAVQLRSPQTREQVLAHTLYGHESEQTPVIPALAALLRHLGSSPAAPPSCRSCAVVGSSGALLAAPAGAQIDAAECVFRVNAGGAHEGAFEAAVGKRTTVHVWTLPTLWRLGSLDARHDLLARGARAASNLSILALQGAGQAAGAWRLAEADKLPVGRTRILHPLHIARLRRELDLSDVQWPSTGLLAVHLATLVCDLAPVVYGFDAHAVPFHYYDPPDTPCDALAAGRLDGGGSKHDWPLEQRHLRRWQAEGRLTLWRDFTPKPNVSRCFVPRLLRLRSGRQRGLAGLYEAQAAAINGRVAYRSSGAGGSADFLLFFSLCKQGGFWAIAPSGLVDEGQQSHPGTDSTCRGAAFSADFRPEAPAAGHWQTLLDGRFVDDHSLRVRVAG